MLKTLAAAVLVLGLTGAAHAAPPASKLLGAEAAQNAGIVQVQHRDRHRRGHWDNRRHRGPAYGHRGWRGGPPAGWRRYSTRPWDYRRRGCVMVGPVWFCP